MLNRNAEALFWVGRYMERAENHARLIDVHYYQQDEAETSPEGSDKWLRIVDALGSRPSFEAKYTACAEEEALHYLTLDRDNENSLFSCIHHARGNLRTLREKLPTELWDVVNAFYLWLKQQLPEGMLRESPHRFLMEIREWTALFLGTTESVMPRENEWHFLSGGRYLERAENTLRILKSVRGIAAGEEPDQVYAYYQAVLKSVSGFQVFRRYNADAVTVDAIVEFLVLHAAFPRSVHHAVRKVEGHLKGIELSDSALKREHQKLVRQTARLTAELSCMERDDLLQEGGGEAVSALLASCNRLGAGFASTFFRLGEATA